MLIQASILGAISDPNQWKEFSCITEDGTLDKRKYAEYMQMYANQGANCTRELPFLLTDKSYGSGPRQRNFLPAIWRNGKYDWDLPNGLYYNNLKEMIKIANRHNMAFQVSIFDRCHSASMPHSPWRLNHQGIERYYDWNWYAVSYVAKVIDTVKMAERELSYEGLPLKVLFELENEPISPAFPISGVETLKILLEAGFKKDQIECGVNYYPGKNQVNYFRILGAKILLRAPEFEVFKKAKRDAGLYPGFDLRDKSRYFTTVHNFDDTPGLIEDLKIAIRHTRRFSISNDGVTGKHNADRWKKLLAPILGNTRKRNPNLKRWKFEHVYRGDLDGYSSMGDAIDGVEGISRAYMEKTGIEPENYNKVPHVNYGPDNADMDNIIVITRAYQGILGRAPDQSGLWAYAKYLKEGGSVRGFCERLVSSPEFKRFRSRLSLRKLAVQLYRGILGRSPDSNGLKHSIQEISAGRLAIRASAMLESEEFKRKIAA